MPRYVVGLDIGSGTIKAAVGELKKDGNLHLVRVLKSPSEGIRKGMIDDLPSATRSVNIVFNELREISKNINRNVFVSIGSPHVKAQTSRGIVAVSRADLEIYKDDIARAIEASESIKLPANRMVVHSLTEEFAVDDVGGIKDPLEMVGNRLEARSIIIDAFSPGVRNLTRCVETAGGSISGLIFNPLASGKAVLSKSQKDLGVVVVDIGFATTSMAVYQENKLLHTNSFPVGSGHVTNDLAIGLKTSIGAAESIKFTYGSALAKEVPIRETVEMRKFDETMHGNTSRRFIAEIIEVRLAEIMEFIHNELRQINRVGQLPAGVVLVGGGAKLPGFADLAKQELRLPARVGITENSGFSAVENADLISALEDPEFACSLGLVLWGTERMTQGKTSNGSLGNFARKIFNYFMP